MTLTDKQIELCELSRWDFSDLSALFLNCTLKKTPEMSHTEGLIQMSMGIMEKSGLKVDSLRPVDYNVANGVYPDMTEHGWEVDDWPRLYEKVKAADILVITSPYGWAKNLPSARRSSSVFTAHQETSMSMVSTHITDVREDASSRETRTAPSTAP